MHALVRTLALLLLGLVLTELLLRLMFWPYGLGERLTHNLGPASSRLGWLHYRRHMPQDPMFLHDPELGWVNRPGVREESGHRITVNAQGFRGLQPVPAQAPEGTRRVVVLGDSFAFGSDGDDAWTFPVQLAALRPDLDVVNLGVPGYAYDQVWLRYLRDARPLDPDVVVVCASDLLAGRSMSDFFLYAKPIVRAELGDFAPVGLPIPDEPTLRRRLLTTPFLAYLGQMAWWAAREGSPERSTQRRARAEGLLRRLAQDVRADGALPLVMWCEVPWTSDVPPRPWFGADCPDEAQCVVTTPELEAEKRAGHDIRAGAHWSEAGHRAVARTLDAAIPR